MSPRPLALVAGVGDGLGKAVARRFARAGHLAVLVARKQDKLLRIAAEIAAQGGEAVVRTADLRFDDQIHAVFDEVAGLGRLDVAVFNAGAQHRQPFLEIDPAMFEKVWRLGCRAGFIAQTYYSLHCQDRSAWSLELDIRPWCEKF